MADIKCFASRAIRWNDRRVEVRFAEVDGRLVCIGLEIGPMLVDGTTFVNVTDDDLRPLATAEVRVPLRRLVDMALQAAFMQRAGTGDFSSDLENFRKDLEVLEAAQSEPRKRPGRPPAYSAAHFQEVAHVYREHERAGGRSPTKAVQEHFRSRKDDPIPVTKSAAAKWVARARQRGELEPTEGGTSK